VKSSDISPDPAWDDASLLAFRATLSGKTSGVGIYLKSHIVDISQGWLQVAFHAGSHPPADSQLPGVFACPVQFKGFVYGTLYTNHPLYTGEVAAQMRKRMQGTAAACADVLQHLESIIWTHFAEKHPGISIRKPVTRCEHELLTYLNSGLRPQEIPPVLSVSLSTVRTHLQHAYDKLGAHGVVPVLAASREAGLFLHLD
jgi:DNA-binding CsgD family transcriptional regulator